VAINAAWADGVEAVNRLVADHLAGPGGEG